MREKDISRETSMIEVNNITKSFRLLPIKKHVRQLTALNGERYYREIEYLKTYHSN